jgi:HEAT repeat protein
MRQNRHFNWLCGTAAGALVALVAPGDVAARGLPKDLDEAQLIETLDTGAEGPRVEACKRLGKRRSPSAIPAVGKVARNDPSAKVRRYCIGALEDIGTKASASFLKEAAASDSDEEVRQHALAALERVGTEEDMAELVIKILDGDGSIRMRREAAKVLGSAKWASGQEHLIKCVKGDQPIELREECLDSLILIGQPSGYEVIHETLLMDPSAEMRERASRNLEHHPVQGSLEPLCKALKDPDEKVVKNAVDALVRLGNRKAAPALREAASGVGDRLARQMNKAAAELER